MSVKDEIVSGFHRGNHLHPAIDIATIIGFPSAEAVQVDLSSTHPFQLTEYWRSLLMTESFLFINYKNQSFTYFINEINKPNEK